MLKKLSSIIFLGVVMAACTNSQQFQTVTQNSNFQDREKRAIFLDDMPLQVEIVFTAESTAQGLSGRTEIGADGMLFVFSDTNVRNFWMKEMLFPLDIIWIKDGVVAGITSNVPAPDPGTSSQKLPLYSSNEEVDMVLELPAGMAESRKIEIGSRLRFE